MFLAMQCFVTTLQNVYRVLLAGAHILRIGKFS
jgi:hypothetical protein